MRTPIAIPSLHFFTALVPALLLAACGIEVGSGRVVDEVRTVGSFTRISLEDGIDADVTLGDTSLRLTTDDNLMPFIETVVEGDTLHVRVRGQASVSGSAGIRATVVTGQLHAVSASGASHVTAIATPVDEWSVDASGASKVTVTGISATTVRASASGSSELNFTGTAKELVADASGASRVHSDGLPVEDLKVDGSGASVFESRATVSARGSLSGASKASIIGSPTIRDISTSGASSVTWR